MNRSMESNGPDVRIRGTAAHIAEKYAQLANDAQTAGDTVGAQSYWQFAEHYNRLVATAQAAIQAAREEQEARRESRSENRETGSREENSGSETANSHETGSDNRSRNQNRNKNRSHENEEVDGVDDRSEVREARGRQRKSVDRGKSPANVSGDGPQPTLDTVPAEVALNEKPVEVEKAEPPKRVRRPRKPKEDSPTTDALPAFVTGTK